MAGDPYPTDDTIDIVVSVDFAAQLLAEVHGVASKRVIYPVSIGEHGGGAWRVEKVSTRRSDAQYDDIVATFRRVLL